MTRREFLAGLSASGLAGCAWPKGEGAETIRIVHLGDPQFGFSPPPDTEESYRACLDRFLRMVEKTNVLRPDLAVVSGDMCHRAVIPPFDQAVGEADSYNNYPLSGRAQRLARYREAGLNLYLAGHTHRYGNRTVEGLTILNPETTSRNFDQRPFGGRLLTLRPDHAYRYEFLSV